MMREQPEGEAGLQLDRVQRSIERWRQQYGGPGRPIPGELWDQAVAVARVEGVEATARALRLDRGRLAGRVARAADALSPDNTGAGDFVELDARGLWAPGQTVVRLLGRDGERLEIALSPTSTVDVATLARAFWSRPR